MIPPQPEPVPKSPLELAQEEVKRLEGVVAQGEAALGSNETYLESNRYALERLMEKRSANLKEDPVPLQTIRDLQRRIIKCREEVASTYQALPQIRLSLNLAKADLESAKLEVARLLGPPPAGVVLPFPERRTPKQSGTSSTDPTPTGST